MNKAIESRTLATQVKEAVKGSANCVIEIHSPTGNPSGQRLLKSLSISGVKASLSEIVATPNTGILLAASQARAGVGLAVQRAFRVATREDHFLVQNTRRPYAVIIHLGAD